MTLSLKSNPTYITMSISPDGGLTIYGPGAASFSPEETVRLRDYIIEHIGTGEGA